MKDPTTQLTNALHERLALIADENSRRDVEAHMERLRQVSERVSELARELPQPIDPRLKHYLERSSYGKALEFLEGTGD